MKHTHIALLLFIFSAIVSFSYFPVSVLGASTPSSTSTGLGSYKPISIVDSHGSFPIKESEMKSAPAFLNALLRVAVGVAAILAVIMVTVGGFKYMTTDSMFKMTGAKEQITNAIVGLVIVLAGVLFLMYINPEIVSMNLF